MLNRGKVVKQIVAISLYVIFALLGYKIINTHRTELSNINLWIKVILESNFFFYSLGIYEITKKMKTNNKLIQNYLCFILISIFLIYFYIWINKLKIEQIYILFYLLITQVISSFIYIQFFIRKYNTNEVCKIMLQLTIMISMFYAYMF